MVAARKNLRLVWVLALRGLNEILRVPGASIPGILAPTIFMAGAYSMFGRLEVLPGFVGTSYIDWVFPLGMLQSAAFTGAATGVNLARDIESGWFDRMLLSPVPRGVILGGIVVSATVRLLLPVGLLLCVGWALGLDWPGVDGLAISIALAMVFTAAMASWSCDLAIRFGSQDAAPLMQSTGFVLVQFSTAFAPLALLAPWLREVAELNPVTYVIGGVRQGFLGGVNWADSWPALLAVVGLLVLTSALSLRSIARVGR
jgi:ABC-2 type transport system permease protein